MKIHGSDLQKVTVLFLLQHVKILINQASVLCDKKYAANNLATLWWKKIDGGITASMLLCNYVACTESGNKYNSSREMHGLDVSWEILFSWKYWISL